MLKKKVKYIVGRLRCLVHGIKWGRLSENSDNPI